MFTTGWIVLYIWITYWLVWGIFAVLTGKKSERTKNLFNYLGIIIFIPFLSLMRVMAIEIFLLSPVLPDLLLFDILGFILLIAGLSFAVWARVILGCNWSGDVRIIADQKLVCVGPYKMVRHPIYLGILVGLIGTISLLHDLISIILLTISVVALIKKSRSEEILLSEQFPLEYQRYKKETKMLIPFVL